MDFDEKYTEDTYILFNEPRMHVVFINDKGGSSTYNGINKRKHNLIAYRIDGGLMGANDGKQCDFGLYCKDLKELRLIELKGSDVDEAFKQLENTIKRLLDHSINSSTRVFARIVASKVKTPDIKTQTKIRLEKLLLARNGNLKYCSKVMKDIIS